MASEIAEKDVYGVGQNFQERETGDKILIIDDEPTIVDFVTVGLEREGFEVRACYDGLDALREVYQWQPDLVILDLMLPGIDGYTLCKALRAGSDVPIIMLTAKDAVEDRVQGLNTGADDYITKPFAFQELVARVRAVLRRHAKETPQNSSLHLSAGDLVLNRSTHEVMRGGQRIMLTAKEFELLELLMRHAEHVVSREEILENVWKYDFNGETNIIDVYIRQLRQKLDDNPPRLIQTVRGIGYILRTDPGE